jgi:hypothetical protein
MWTQPGMFSIYSTSCSLSSLNASLLRQYMCDYYSLLIGIMLYWVLLRWNAELSDAMGLLRGAPGAYT